jgi:HEAT repeat protein
MKKQSMLKSSIIIFSFVAAIGVAAPLAGHAQSRSEKAQEEQIYKSGTAAMNSGEWQNAINQFSQIKGSNIDGATYWKAYAQNKLGQRTAALETIALLIRQYPRSKWVTDAKALQIEIQGVTGQTAAPAADGDEELRLLALNSILNMDPEQAVPLIEKVLAGSTSAKVKEHALFVLSQSSSARAQDLMASIARGQAHTDLQIKAIQNLGMAGKKKLLSEVYAGSSPEAKRAALRAMGMAGAKDELFGAARSERDPQLRKEAINSLAVSGGRDQLRQLYKEATDPQTKRELLRTAVMTGDQELLTNAMSDSDVEIRREALRTLGVTGGSNVTSALVTAYNMDKDQNVRLAAIDALFVHGAAHELIELAKKETDPGMRRRLVEKLSLMDSKEVKDYMLQLLEK